jgi:hypothetical protein
LEGPDKGCLYVTTGFYTSHPDWVYKVWKNKDQGGRWWFKRVIGGGSAKAPTVAGQSVPALTVDLRQREHGAAGAGVVIGADGKVYLQVKSQEKSGAQYLYLYDEEKGSMTCVLSVADYANKVNWMEVKGQGVFLSYLVPAVDGSFYLGFSNPRMFYKVSADRTKVEKLLHGNGKTRTRFDGPALKSGWFDGPALTGYYPPDILFGCAVDDSFVRRYRDGRVSTLCKDGEWREFPGDPGTGEAGDNIKDNQAVNWGRSYVLGKDCLYQTYYLGMGSSAIYKCGPIDFAKPTVGPLVEDK